MRCPNPDRHEPHWHTVRADNITVAGGRCEGEPLARIEPPPGGRVMWRQGRKVGRTIYLQIGPEPSDDDVLIGVMDTPELAAEAVDARNRASEGGA